MHLQSVADYSRIVLSIEEPAFGGGFFYIGYDLTLKSFSWRKLQMSGIQPFAAYQFFVVIFGLYVLGDMKIWRALRTTIGIVIVGRILIRNDFELLSSMRSYNRPRSIHELIPIFSLNPKHFHRRKYAIL
jgi:hypothetical protein